MTAGVSLSVSLYLSNAAKQNTKINKVMCKWEGTTVKTSWYISNASTHIPRNSQL